MFPVGLAFAITLILEASMTERVVSGDLVSLLQQSRKPRVLVVGDLMRDRYIWGDVDRSRRGQVIASSRQDDHLTSQLREAIRPPAEIDAPS